MLIKWIKAKLSILHFLVVVAAVHIRSKNSLLVIDHKFQEMSVGVLLLI